MPLLDDVHRWTAQLPVLATRDTILNQISLDEQRVLISKNSGFFYSHLVLGRPWKLVLIKTGNMSKRELCSLFERHLSDIEEALDQYTLLDRAAVTPLI